MSDDPVLPYPEPEDSDEHTQGWSGSETSQERALWEARSGTASARQRYALDLVGGRRYVGMTWSELSDATGWHHGRTSAVLSVLHQAGRLCRLKDKRGRSKIYVTPAYVGSRETEPYRPNRRKLTTVALTDEQTVALETLRERLDEGLHLLTCVDSVALREIVELVEKMSGHAN